MVGDEINKRKNQIQNRLTEIKSTYSPDTFESRIEGMDVTIGKLESDFDDIDKGYKGFLSTPGLEDLVNSGYGTPQYKSGPLHAQYYHDWKRADQIVEELRASSWDDIQSRWQIISSGHETAKQQLIEAQEQKESLKRLHDEYQTLTASSQNVGGDVLDACRVRLKSELDLRVDKSSDLMRSVAEIDKQMQQSSNRINNELQDRRSKVHDQMLSLQQIVASASASRRRMYRMNMRQRFVVEVDLRLTIGVIPVRDVITKGTARAWYYDDWIIPPTHTNTIIEYFGVPSYGSVNTYNNYSDPTYSHRSDITESNYGHVS